MLFSPGEGLPGTAWAQRRPIVLKNLDVPYFKRAEAARAAGLTCGIALPIFAGEFLLAVAVFFCGDDEEHVGAIELWSNNPAESHELGLIDGYYGSAEVFERDSRYIKFRPGFGLPGIVWQTGIRRPSWMTSASRRISSGRRAPSRWESIEASRSRARQATGRPTS